MHSPLPATALLTVLLSAAGAAGAGTVVSKSDFAQIMPPPGLYRIDSDSTLQQRQGQLAHREQRDGASGDTTATSTAPDGSTTRRFKGDGPDQVCIPARGAAAPVLPPAMSAAGCKTVSSTAGANGIVHVAQCSTGRVTVTVRRLSASTWELTDQAEMGGMGAQNLSAMRPLFERMAREGTTEEQRAQARQMLATLPQQQARLDAQRAQAMSGLAQAQAEARTPQDAAAIGRAMQAAQQNTPTMQVTGHQRWTRIADSCGAGTAH